MFFLKLLGFLAAPAVTGLAATAAGKVTTDKQMQYTIFSVAQLVGAVGCYLAESSVKPPTTKAILRGGAWGCGTSGVLSRVGAYYEASQPSQPNQPTPPAT